MATFVLKSTQQVPVTAEPRDKDGNPVVFPSQDKITWSSSDEAVVSVVAGGILDAVVKATGAGTATVTAVATDDQGSTIASATQDFEVQAAGAGAFATLTIAVGAPVEQA